MAARTKPRRGTRSFLRQVAEELPMHLPPDLRELESEQWGRFYKVWYGDKRLHFETQFLPGGRLEIGFHMEADPETNEKVAAALERKAAKINRALGDDVKVGSHGPKWRSMAERWSGGDLGSEEAATEAAARLAEYIQTILPLLPR
jgi:hypothetical protein